MEREEGTAPALICRRCGRPAVGWPLVRADQCSPRRWVSCLREPEIVRDENARLASER